MEALWLFVMDLSMLLFPTLQSVGGGLELQTSWTTCQEMYARMSGRD